MLTNLLGDLERSRLVVEDDEEGVGRAGAILALAALILVGIVVALAQPPGIPIAELKTPSPTFTRMDSGTPMPTEAQAWGAVWSDATGIAVFRPMWLPKRADEYQVFPSVRVSTYGFTEYDFSYYEVHTPPQTTVWHIDFVAVALEAPGRGFTQFSGVPEDLTVRGHAAELTGDGSPGWLLVWSEGGYRYAIEAFAVSREDLLRIAGSLAQVIDGTGTPGTRSE